MVETPHAMLHAEEIAAASDRLTVLVMGTNDLAKELYAEHVPGRQPLLTGLALALLGARAAGKVIIDGVYNDVQDARASPRSAAQGRELGFDGKTLIHPRPGRRRQRRLRARASRRSRTRAGPAAWEEAAAAPGRHLNGRMVENLHVESAQRVLSMHEAIQALDAA